MSHQAMNSIIYGSLEASAVGSLDVSTCQALVIGTKQSCAMFYKIQDFGPVCNHRSPQAHIIGLCNCERL